MLPASLILSSAPVEAAGGIGGEVRIVLLLAVVSVVVLAGSRLGFGNRNLPAGIRELTRTGSVFIILGVLMGPQAAGLVSGKVLTNLGPVIVIALGWIGFLYGSHFEWKRMRRLTPRYFGAAALESVFTLALVAGVSYWILGELFPSGYSTRERLLAALVLGVTAGGTLPAGIFLLAGDGKLKGRNLRALKTVSVLDDLPSLLILGIVSSFMHPQQESFELFAGLEWLGISVGLGLAFGVIMHILFPSRGDVRSNSLVLFGMITLCAGASAVMDLSPLFSCAVAGLVFANVSGRKESAYGLLSEREHNLYVIFLLIAGMVFMLDLEYAYVLAPFYLFLRTAGKFVGGAASSELFLRPIKASRALGAGMLFQGGMSLAVLISFMQIHGQDAGLLSHAAATVVLSVIASELFAPFVTVKALGGRARR